MLQRNKCTCSSVNKILNNNYTDILKLKNIKHINKVV
nr:MAG TPA: hypothetical protein [Caudoviricetes sp.]